jgi:hypothetical protein
MLYPEANRVRVFDYNRQLVGLRSNNIGDTLLLNFFDDKQYTATIQRVSVNDMGRTVITARIVESEFAYCFITVSDSNISISAELPLRDEYFFASTKNGQSFLGKRTMTDIQNDKLESDGPLLPDSPPIDHEIINTNNIEPNFMINSPSEVVIDLLLVYTPAAANWAQNSSQYTDIDHVIDIAIERGNLVMANSNTGVVFNIVHRHLTMYTESNTSLDLTRLTDPNDGHMDEVHVLRDMFYADVIVFLAFISYTGGAAWLLTSTNGFWDDSYASSINRVQQSASGYTVVHEIGHNMGAHHHREQNFQPGPNHALGNYSSAWRGVVSGSRVSTIMSYTDGSFFPDGMSNSHIPYLSSPTIILNGVPIGNASTMDNRRVILETRVATAGYRTRPISSFDVAPFAHHFGSFVVGQNSPIQTFTVFNNSSTSVTVNSISKSGAHPDNFHIVATGFPWVIPFGDSRTFTTTFSPQFFGNMSAHLIIENNSTTPSIIVRLNGIGDSVIPIPYAQNFNTSTNLSNIGWSGHFSQGSAIIPGSGVNNTNALTINVRPNNTTQSAATPKIGAVSADTSLSFAYRIVNFTTNWGGSLVATTLGADESVFVEVSTNGPNGVFTVIDTINNSTHSPTTIFITKNLDLSSFVDENINIRFRAVANTGDWFVVIDDVQVLCGGIMPSMTISSTSHNFGNVVFGFTSPAQPFTITNTGDVILYIESIIRSGGDHNNFNIRNNANLPWILLPNETRTFSAVFSPSSLGAKNTNILVSYNSITSPAVIAITGTGIISVPGRVTLASPANNTDNQSINPTLSWLLRTGTVTGYYVYLATSENPFDPENIENNRVAIVEGATNLSWTHTADLEPKTTYHWQVVAFNNSGLGQRGDSWRFETTADVHEDDFVVDIAETLLRLNYPNPFNPSTRIQFEIGNGKTENVIISIYNVRGQRVRTLVNGLYEAGEHSVVWNGIDDNGHTVSSGIYFYRMTAGEYSAVRRMILLK